MADRIAQFTVGIGGDATDLTILFAAVKSQVTSAVADMKRQTERLELFGSINDNLPKVSAALESAKAKVAQFTAEIQKIESTGAKAPKALTDALAAAEKQVTQTSREFNNQTQKLNELGAALKKAGVDTSNLAGEQTRLAAASKAAAEAAALQAAKQQLGLTTLKDISPEVARLRAAYDTLKNSGTASASEIQAAQGLLTAKIKELNATVTQTGIQFKTIGDAKAQLTALIAPVTAVIGALGGVTAALRDILAANKEYQGGLREISILTNASATDIAALGVQVRKLSVDVGLDLGEALRGVRELIRGGIPADNALEALRAAAEASKAAMADLGVGVTATKVLVQSFGVPVKDVGAALDVLNVAAKNGGPTLAEFGATAGNLGVVARATHADFNEVTAALTVMTRATGDAGEASSTLAKILVNLSKEDVQQALRKLGIEGQGIADTFRKLDEKGLNINEFLNLGVANTKASVAVAALKNSAKELPDVLDKFGKSAGANATEAAKQFDTTKERIERFNAALKETEIRLGLSSTGIGKLASAGAVLLDQYNQLSDATQKVDRFTAPLSVNIARLTIELLNAYAASQKNAQGLKDVGAAAEDQVSREAERIARREKLQADEDARREKSVAAIKGAVTDLLDLSAKLRDAGTAAVAEIEKRAEAEIAALDRSLKAQVSTADATAAIQKKAAADRLAVIQDTENQIRVATEKAIAERTALANKDADVQRNLAQDVAKLRIGTLSGVLAQYTAHYADLTKQAQAFQATQNQIETARISFNESVQDKIRGIRLSGLSDVEKYSETVREVDRLIAEGRQKAATEGIDSATKYFEKAKELAGSVTKAVNDDGVVVISQFQAQQTAIDLIKKAQLAYNAELDKAGEKAKTGATTTRDSMQAVGDKIKELQKQLDDLNKTVAQGIRLEIAQDIRGIDAARAAIAELVKPETKIITVRTVQPGAEGSPEFVGPPSPRFAQGGPVLPWRRAAQRFAGGGPVFSRPNWSKVPGIGDGDTVPALLSEGSFVMRKAASQYYGDGLMGALARGYASGGAVTGYAEGGKVDGRTQAQLAVDYSNSLLPYLRGPFFSEFVKQFVKDIRYVEENPDDPEGIKTLFNDAISVADNYSLQRSAGFTSGDYARVKPLPSIEEYLGKKKIPRKYAFQPSLWGTMDALDKAFETFGYANAQQSFVPRNQKTGFASGGSVGPDTVPAMLTPGEWVIPPRAVKLLGGGFLTALNQMRLPPLRIASPPVPRFAQGGPVPGAAIPVRGTARMDSSPINITINAAGGNLDDPAVQRRLGAAMRELLRKSA